MDFARVTREWFASAFPAASPVQREGWRKIAAGAHTLLCAPTGSGKTLAAFLWCLDRLSRPGATEGVAGVRVVYVSPLKALAYDIERNLALPLAGMRAMAEKLGEPLAPVRAVVRTGDTPAKERRRLLRDPGEILITTPESLYLLLGSRAREVLATVDTVIVDEIHALAATKRGVHLALSLERLAALTGRDPQRIGLSATQKPLEEIARYLGGDRPVAIVDTSEPPAIDLVLEMPESAPAVEGAADSERTIWPAIEARVLELVRAHRSTIVFTNSRRLCERLAERINSLAGEPLVRAHHGSVARAQRVEIEDLLKAGKLAGIVATSSMELGIDMGAVDLVVQIESPGAVSRGLQRVGRAGHQVGERSAGRIFPKHRNDLLEAAVVARGMRAGDVEPTRVPRNTLDVLAQQIVALSGERDWPVDELEALVRRAYSFRELPAASFRGVLAMLAGQGDIDLPELKPRLVWDRATDVISGRKDARALALINGGTIPDRGLYGVYLGEDGPRIGELDEEMVHESRAGQTFVLGASTWRILAITRDRVVVAPAPGEPGRMPFWRGEGPGRPLAIGRQVGALVREAGGRSESDAVRWLGTEYGLTPGTGALLWRYLDGQRQATGTLPSDRAIVVERFRDELGDWRICLHTPFGARVHAPWALALEGQLGRPLQAIWSDDGIALRFPAEDDLGNAQPPPGALPLCPDPDRIEELLLEELADSAVFASHFRENAARALLLPRRRAGMRTPLWLQRLRAQSLLGATRDLPSFPIVLETYRECMSDVFDVPGLTEVLRAIKLGELEVVEVETRTASPFAQSLAFAYVQAFLYEGDAPLAERRAQALTLDRDLLAELLGRDELVELIEPAVLGEVEAELQGLAEDRRARSADGVADLLRRVGDLSDAELAARTTAPGLVEALGGRVLRVELGGEPRWIAVEDAGRYRDACAVRLPGVVPSAFLATLPSPLVGLVARHARTHAPFVAKTLAARWGLARSAVEAAIAQLVVAGKLVRLGDALHVDAEVLRLLRRRTLARLRNQVAPVDAPALARFLPAWHGVGGAAKLPAVVAQLEGYPLPFSDLERAILPARVAGFQGRMLDELGALGEVVWIGQGALGRGDGRVALFRRQALPLLLATPELPEDASPLARSLLERLEARGASFFGELVTHAAGAPATEVLEALWSLVWAGLVTNDTFQPLRARGRPAPRHSIPPAVAGGRWSAVRPLLALAPPPSDTQRLHARALALLERYGVVTREAALAEDVAGGFAALSPVYRAMEEAGKIRRGYFVEGLGGLQVAQAAAVERLRAERDAGGAVHVLAASDPANPFGALLPWPEPALRRSAGARVILSAGAPVAYLEPGGKHLRLFDPGQAEAVVAGLRLVARDRRDGELRIEKVNGDPALRSEHAGALESAGLRVQPGALVAGA